MFLCEDDLSSCRLLVQSWTFIRPPMVLVRPKFCTCISCTVNHCHSTLSLALVNDHRRFPDRNEANDNLRERARYERDRHLSYLLLVNNSFSSREDTNCKGTSVYTLWINVYKIAYEKRTKKTLFIGHPLKALNNSWTFFLLCLNIVT